MNGTPGTHDVLTCRHIATRGRSADQVFPTGVFHKGGNYSSDVNIPIPYSEKSNPLFPGCIDRNA